jgi:tetratricopeptide (TPR) repeat protein
MQPTETANGPPDVLADLRKLVLRPGVLREESPGGFALWLPGERGRGFQHWDRINILARSVFTPAPGVIAASAGGVALRQALGGALHRLWRRIRSHRSEASWVVPGGGAAEPCGDRQTDLLVAGSADAESFDAARVRELWPRGGDVRQLGPAFFLVRGVPMETVGAASMAAAASPDARRQLAETRLAEARSAGDCHNEAIAGTDLALIELREGRTDRAVELLEEARRATANTGNWALECDVLVNLGYAMIQADQSRRALPILEQALALAREVGDRFAEKLALERLGHAHTGLRDCARALEYFEQALALATATGDRKQQAELLWYMAIQQAEAGRSDWSQAHAQAAVDLLEKAQDPRAAVYADHLRRFSTGSPPAGAAGGSIPPSASQAAPRGELLVVQAGASNPVTGQPPQKGPGLLKMALTATTSAVRHAGSGFRNVSEAELRRRLNTCAACEQHTGLRCRVCGCFTTFKTRMAHERCPAGKW